MIVAVAFVLLSLALTPPAIVIFLYLSNLKRMPEGATRQVVRIIISSGKFYVWIIYVIVLYLVWSGKASTLLKIGGIF